MARARLNKGGGLASAPVRMGGAGASGAYSLASSIVSLVFFIVSFVFISLVIIISEHTAAMVVVNGMQGVWTTHGPREQRRWRAHLRSVRVPDAPAASRPTVSQWPVPRASHPAFDVQAHVAV